NISSPDVTILPETLPSRQGYEVLAAEFGVGEISPHMLVFQSPTSIYEPENLGQIYDFSARLTRDERIDRVVSIVPAMPGVSKEQTLGLANAQRGLAALGIGPDTSRIANQNTTVILAYPNALPNEEESKDLLAELR